MNVRYNRSTNEFDAVRDTFSSLPQVMWHVTDVCPLSCAYCFATKTPHSFGAEVLEPVLRVLDALGVQKVDIAGGEPLTWKPLPRLLELIENRAMAATITTTGIGTPANRIWLLENAQRFARVIVSLDAATATDHDSLRSYEGAFEITSGLLRDLHSGNYCRTRINTVVVKSTLSSSAKEFSRLVTHLAPAEWCLIQPHPANKKSLFDSHAVTAREFQSFAEHVSGLLNAAKSSTRLLIRTIDDYAGYWVLYPDGMLRQHTTGPSDRGAMPILDTPIERLRDRLQTLGVTLPRSAT